MQTKTIDFVENATPRQAGVYALRYAWAFVKGVSKILWRGLNRFVHHYPWVCIGVVVIAAFAINFICIAQARSERDGAFFKQARLQQQVEQLSCALNAKNETKR